MNKQTLFDTMLDQYRRITIVNSNSIKREFDINKVLSGTEVSTITGVRRCGKSTLLKQIASECTKRNYNLHYLNFEDNKLTNFTASDFKIAYNHFIEHSDQTKKNILIYDEVQNVPEWEKWVSPFNDDEKNKVIISGSNAYVLSSELSTLLTGRHKQYEITPLTFRELIPNELQDISYSEPMQQEDKVTLRKIYASYLEYGGFPRAFLDQSTEILEQYYQDIIFKDIGFRKKVRNTTQLNALSIILASQNTRLFNKSKITPEVGLKDINTLTKFCSYFIETYLYREIRCFSESMRKQLRSLSKFFCVDPVLAQTCGYHGGDVGYWKLENLVFNTLIKIYKEIWYWTSKSGHEIDFVVKEKDGSLTGFQVAYSLTDEKTKLREIRAIEDGFKELKLKSAFIITDNEFEEISIYKNHVQVVPFYRWCLG